MPLMEEAQIVSEHRLQASNEVVIGAADGDIVDDGDD